ncbi:transposase [Xanthomonas oryzae pv. oryzicola]|nr:transposase [Xanthomonas oryzae pv. oryzicola]
MSDLPTVPTQPCSTVWSVADEVAIVAFRQHTLLPLDDCLYALQPSIAHLRRSSLHRCLQRHGISRLPDITTEKPARKRFKRYPIGYFHIDIAAVQTSQGKLYFFVAIDRTSKFALTDSKARGTSKRRVLHFSIRPAFASLWPAVATFGLAMYQLNFSRAAATV